MPIKKCPEIKRKTILLLILDGFGYNEEKRFNAISQAHTPTWDSIWDSYPRGLIKTSGSAVGLPEGQMGNSEVGHITLGAGRVIHQNFARINSSIRDGSFSSNKAYCGAIDRALVIGGAVHILGLLSDGGVHSHSDHINSVIELAATRGAKKIYLHAFLDGRDCPPRSAISSIKKTQALFKTLGVGSFASIIGRFYALDRDNRWDRIEAAYKLITEAEGVYVYKDPLTALAEAYSRGETDEFISATSIQSSGKKKVKINDQDAVIFMNFRPDRARELTRALVGGQDFEGFKRSVVKDMSNFVMTTEYEAGLDQACAFPPQKFKNSLGQYLSKRNRRQLRIAETEKYAHVTFFFNGGQEASFEGEERILKKSPNVSTYDLKPEMSAPEITASLVDAIQSQRFDVIICNYANCDMVGHTGNFTAAIEAVEAVDAALSSTLRAINKIGGEALVTADHGNIEQMYDPIIKQPHTQHTTLPVPIVYVGPKNIHFRSGGSLADVAPTILALLKMRQPEEMTGISLVYRPPK